MPIPFLDLFLRPVRITLMSCGFMFVALLSGCGEGAQAPQATPPSVLVVTAKEEPVHPRVEFVGRTESIEDVKIRTRVGGVLLHRFFKEGDDVKQGAALFEIDPAPFRTVVSERRAGLQKARSDLQIATRNHARGKTLVEQGVISRLDMDKLGNQYESAKAGLQKAEAGLKEAELNLGYTKILAPLDGRIGRSKFALGDVVNPGTDTLASLVKLDPIYVAFQVSEKAIVSSTQAMLERERRGEDEGYNITMQLRLPNDTIYEHEGRIQFMDNRVDAATGTLSVRATFPNPDALLLPGQYVDVIIIAKDPERVVMIPQASIQEDQQGRFVMLVDENNVVARRRVEMGQRYGIDWAVESGLKPGERVIVEGLQKVRAGITVEVAEREHAPFTATQQ